MTLPNRKQRAAFSDAALFAFCCFDSYFMLGMMMPRRMIFWQEMKMIIVGMDTTMKPALTIHGAADHHWAAWYIHTAIVHMDLS